MIIAFFEMRTREYIKLRLHINSPVERRRVNTICLNAFKKGVLAEKNLLCELVFRRKTDFLLCYFVVHYIFELLFWYKMGYVYDSLRSEVLIRSSRMY